MKYLLLRMKRFCGFITGLTFFISGLVKLMDPVGAGLVMKEYYDFLHIGFMAFSAKDCNIMGVLSTHKIVMWRTPYQTKLYQLCILSEHM